MVHITGGGFYDNIPRILPENCDADVNAGAWEVPVVFKNYRNGAMLTGMKCTAPLTWA